MRSPPKRERMTASQRAESEKRAHELKLSLLDAFKKDPELKYYLGVAGGAGVAIASSLIGSLQTPQDAKQTFPNPSGVDASKVGWFWLSTAGGLPGVALWLVDSTQTRPTNPTQILTDITSLGGLGFAGFCASILYMKAIFGEAGASKLLDAVLPG